MDKIAIVGTGIAGLGCAHFLHRDHELTLFEQSAQAGGHTNTVTATEPGTGRKLPIDTGFMVFNRVTYPLLCRLFGELGVAVKATDMSFSVRHADSGIEFCGSSLNHLFAQRRNLLRPRFYRMLGAVARFNREAVQALGDPAVRTQTLREYVRRRGYGEDFLRLYLLPMSSAVWSAPPELMLRFPAATLLRFFHNHGFLGLHTQHPWLTVEGGARTYVEKICAPWRDRLRLDQGARRVARGPRGVTVTTAAGEEHLFDRVILACHADQARRLLCRSHAGRGAPPGKIPLPAQRGDAAHRRGGDAPDPPGVGELELRVRPGPRRPDARRDALLDELPAGRVGPRELLRLAQPRRRPSTRRRSCGRSTTSTPSSAWGRSRRRRGCPASTPPPAAARRPTLPAATFATASTRTPSPARSAYAACCSGATRGAAARRPSPIRWWPRVDGLFLVSLWRIFACNRVRPGGAPVWGIPRRAPRVRSLGHPPCHRRPPAFRAASMSAG